MGTVVQEIKRRIIMKTDIVYLVKIFTVLVASAIDLDSG